MRAPLDGAWGSYESVSLGGCIRLDAIFANTGAGGDKDGGTEALGRSKGEGVDGLTGG